MRDEKKTKAQLIVELNELRTENMALGALRAEARRTEAAMQANQEQLRAILEATDDGVLVVGVQGNVIHWNERFANLWRLPVEQVESWREGGLLNDILDRLEDPETFLAKIEGLYETLDDNVDTATFKDGRDLEWFSSPIIKDGKLSARVWTFRDITERKRAEEELRAERQRLYSVLEGLPAYVYLQASDYSIRYANGYFLERFGEVGERLCYEVLWGRKEPCEVCPTFRVFDTKEPQTWEWAESPDGQIYEVYDYPFTDVDGSALVLELGIDITELRRAEEERQKFEAQAQHAQKLESLGVMAGGIAHDFNNLLMTILGNADLALMDMAPEAPGRESVGEIGQAARRAAELTNQMLAYSGHGILKFRPIDLSKLIVEMAHLLEVSHSKKAILNYEFAQNLPAIKADASQLRQVVMSLITNASEAIDAEDGFIRVSTRVVDASREYLANTYVDDDLSPGPYVCLEVQDTGCGMDEEMIGKVFDPFFTTKFMGRGLGLAAVLGIVRGHHGALIIDSSPGRGTTFRVLFPAHLDAPAPSVPEETVEARDWRKSGVVLLVDDEETILALVERMLQRAGFTVLTAADGLDAVALFKKHSAEIICVLLDLTMPRMGGDEALDELRRIRHDVPVILSSGYNEEDLIERFEGRGLAGVIQKPYRYEDLMDKMKQALDT